MDLVIRKWPLTTIRINCTHRPTDGTYRNRDLSMAAQGSESTLNPL